MSRKDSDLLKTRDRLTHIEQEYASIRETNR
jgi:predicted  nucleic acid-binding Zn-ribbon protein